MLRRLQLGLETLYRIETDACVEDFVIDAERRARMGLSRMPREQMLLAERDGELEMALFVDERALANLADDDPTLRLHDGNLGDFLLAIEGVSHFVYVAWRARLEQALSPLELELQAEVDKYVTCLLGCRGARPQSPRLRRRLFDEFEYLDGLDAEERDRYRVANENARAYSEHLETEFVVSQRIGEMLAELRHFYRLPLAGKLDLIRSAA